MNKACCGIHVMHIIPEMASTGQETNFLEHAQHICAYLLNIFCFVDRATLQQHTAQLETGDVLILQKVPQQTIQGAGSDSKPTGICRGLSQLIG